MNRQEKLQRLKSIASLPEFQGKSHQEIADIINGELRVDVDLESIATAEFAALFRPSEVKSLKPDDAEYLAFLMRADTIILNEITRPAIEAINQRLSLKRQGTIADKVKLGRVTTSDVADALLST